MERIITGFEIDSGRGLPIGSLTSQHFANFYLGWFDRFVKEGLRVRGYVRYMDDCVLVGERPPNSRTTWPTSRAFLAERAPTGIEGRSLSSTGRATGWISWAAASSRATWR